MLSATTASLMYSEQHANDTNIAINSITSTVPTKASPAPSPESPFEYSTDLRLPSGLRCGHARPYLGLRIFASYKFHI